MKNIHLIIIALSCYHFTAIAQNKPCKEIIAYYPDWAVKDRNHLLAPKNIPYSKYTIINFCFFDPKADGSIKEADLATDELILFGEKNKTTSPSTYIPNTGLIELAHKNGVKVMFSVGGWVWSTTFPAIAADPAKRALFASECVRLIKHYKFDGVDVDWEYPGYEEHLGTPADKQNFTIFMAQIRDSLTALGKKTKTDYLLSACFGAGASKIKEIEWAKISTLLDMINVMTYDYYGTWDKTTNHNSPLYTPEQGDAGSMDATFKLITEIYKVPPNKINLGLAFYGHSHLGASKLFGASKNCGDTITFPRTSGGTSYHNIIANKHKFNEYWDEKAQVPYLLGKGGLTTFVSYDNEKSIALKAEYAKRVKARGFIIWEIAGDYVAADTGKKDAGGNAIYKIASTPLVDTVNTIFCK